MNHVRDEIRFYLKKNEKYKITARCDCFSFILCDRYDKFAFTSKACDTLNLANKSLSTNV